MTTHPRPGGAGRHSHVARSAPPAGPFDDLETGDTIDAAEYRRRIDSRLEGAPSRDKFGRAPADERRWNGVLYDSLAEMAYAQELERLRQLGLIAVVIPQPKTRLGVALNVYIPDFFVLYTSGVFEWQDVKGHETEKFKRDKRLWSAHGPGTLRILKRRGIGFLTTEVITPTPKDGT